MPAKKSSSDKGTSGPRELITPNGKGSSRYQRRKADGSFGQSDDVGKSQAADKRQHSSTEPPRNQGDKGDYKKKR